MTTIKTLYRINDCPIWSFDEKKRHDFTFDEIPVIRHTEKGYWIEDFFGIEKFVLAGNGKRYAHETKEQALYSYMKRKNKRLQILTNELSSTQDKLDKAKVFYKEFTGNDIPKLSNPIKDDWSY